MYDKNLQNLRYRLYARKSTDTEDRQVQSLEDQVKYMKDRAEELGLKIIGKPIRESKSAKRPNNRPLFSEMLKEIEEDKIDGIICWKVDRLSRNPTDSGHIQQLLQDDKIKHILAMDRSYFPEDNSIVFSVEASQANEYVRKLAVDTRRGMQSKAEKGDKPGVPPVGYLNDRIDKKVIADPDRFASMRILWDKMLTGTYSRHNLYMWLIKNCTSLHQLEAKQVESRFPIQLFAFYSRIDFIRVNCHLRVRCTLEITLL